MSNYNWARGSVKIPAKYYPKVRDAVIEAHNGRQTFLLKRAGEVYDLLKKSKIKRGTDKRALVEDDYAREEVFGRYSALDRLLDKLDYSEVELIAESLFPTTYKDGTRVESKRMHKPKKKDFPLANSRTKQIDDGGYGDIYIGFDNKTRTISFGCAENNRAQERFLEHRLYSVLKRALDRVEWTRSTGGKLLGNDEYSRDSYEEGAGGNYVLQEWSKEASNRRRKARSSYGALPRFRV